MLPGFPSESANNLAKLPKNLLEKVLKKELESK